MLKIAVLGAGGVVGQAMLELIVKRLPNSQVKAYGASEKTVYAGDTVFYVDLIDSIKMADFDVVLSALPATAAKIWLPKALAAGCFVVDNSSFYRQDEAVPLVVPEINASLVQSKTQLVANPNCVAIPLSVALFSLSKVATLKKINVATYQAASGAGRKAVEELVKTSANVLNCQDDTQSSCFAAPLAFNVVPQIDKMLNNGYTGEEIKIHQETKKILQNNEISLNVTAVRVPVFNGHSMAINCEFANDVCLSGVHDALAKMSTIQITSDVLTPATHAKETSQIWISRIRHDLSCQKTINLWLVSDNILTGAAFNAVRIIEKKFYE